MEMRTLTIKQIREQYGISRYVLMKWAEEDKIKLHKPNGRDYLIAREDVESAYRLS